MSRWYDMHPNLGESLDSLKEMEPGKRSVLIRGVIELVKHYYPNLLLEVRAALSKSGLNSRRWYDPDPEALTFFTSIRKADSKFLDIIADFLRK